MRHSVYRDYWEGERKDRKMFFWVMLMKMTGVNVAFVQKAKIVDPTFAARSFTNYLS